MEEVKEGSREDKAGLKLQNTPKLGDFMRKVAAGPTISDVRRKSLLKYAKESVVPFGFLRDVYLELGPDNVTPIHVVLAGSTFVLDSPKPREKSAELKARLEKLQEMVDKKAYDDLVHDITKHTREPEYFSTYKDQLGFGLHVAVTMFTGFAFGYSIFRAQFQDNPVLHAAGGALGLIIGMLLETVLFIVRDVQQMRFEQDKSKKVPDKSSHTGSDLPEMTNPIREQSTNPFLVHRTSC